MDTQVIRYLADFSSIPRDVNKIIFHENYDEFSDDYSHGYLSRFPSWVTHVTYNDDFNGSLDRLPYGITHLTLGHNFDRSLDELSRNIRQVTLPESYEGDVSSLLDRGVEVVRYERLVDSDDIDCVID